MIGTKWLPDLADHDLLVEEVSEHLYRVDRMMFTVSNATQLAGINSLRVGTITLPRGRRPGRFRPLARPDRLGLVEADEEAVRGPRADRARREQPCRAVRPGHPQGLTHFGLIARPRPRRDQLVANQLALAPRLPGGRDVPQTLEAYHAEIEAMIVEGEALVAARDPATAKRAQAPRRRFDAAGRVVPIVRPPPACSRRCSARPIRRCASRVNEVKVECIALTEDLRFNVKDFLADETPLDWDVTAAKMAWFNGRLKKHIADVRQLMSPDLSDKQHAALIARRIGTVGPVAVA